jgi:RHS repeat-associated protein
MANVPAETARVCSPLNSTTSSEWRGQNARRAEGSAWACAARVGLIYPQGYQFLYGYTQRNQLDNIKLDPAIFGGQYNTPLVRYTYDPSGNRTSRTVLSGAHADYDVDELNRVRGQSAYFANGQSGAFAYGFDAMGRHRYEQRDWGTADGYQYDPSDEVTGYQRDGTLNGDGTVSASFWNNTGIHYDNNGNRTQVTGSGANSYTINNLNQYDNVSNIGNLGYDPKGNLTSAAGWIYTYDAQNRLTRMETGGTVIVQTYDPLNRVITRNVNGAITQNVWEGWNLIEEHRPDWSIQRCYLQGANQNEMVAAFDGGVYTTHWFWQDGRGSISHITGDNAALLERYTYDLSGAPKFYDEWGNERFGGSVYDARFLFAGSQYLPETGLYDMRNRFYSPALNRFLQTDPIGFAGDALNLYRYCGDDPVDRSDPMGLLDDNDTGSHTSLTSFDHGDWVRGSDGLSDWDRDHGMPSNRPAGNISFNLVDKVEAEKKPTEFTSGFHAAMSLKDAAGDAATQSKESPEAWAPYGQDPQTGRWGTGTIHEGNGEDPKFKDRYTEGRHERVQTSDATRGDLPARYEFKGFVLAHKYYNEKFVNRDIARASDKQKSILVVLPQRPGAHVPGYIWRYHEYGSNTTLSNANQ